MSCLCLFIRLSDSWKSEHTKYPFINRSGMPREQRPKPPVRDGLVTLRDDDVIEEPLVLGFGGNFCI